MLLRGNIQDYNAEDLERIPSEFAGMRVLVRYTSTVEQALKEGDRLYSFPQLFI